MAAPVTAQMTILGLLPVVYANGRELSVPTDLARPYPKGTEPGVVVAK